MTILSYINETLQPLPDPKNYKTLNNSLHLFFILKQKVLFLAKRYFLCTGRSKKAQNVRHSAAAAHKMTTESGERKSATRQGPVKVSDGVINDDSKSLEQCKEND